MNNVEKKKRKIIRRIKKIISVVIIIIFILVIHKIIIKKKEEKTHVVDNKLRNEIIDEEQEPIIVNKKITDWRLVLANSENVLPEDFQVELSNIDKERQFDSRAISYLKKMTDDMRKDGIVDVWVQSGYRSIASQKNVYEKSIKKYMEEGKTREEAIALTLKFINQPGASDHNLGLGVDFNYVDSKFAKTEAFKWLKENAEDYGRT